MSAQTTPITERQLDLITRAHGETSGLIEPLLALKGGAKLKMIASLAKRSLIAQIDGQWRLTPAALAIVQGQASASVVTPAQPPQAADPDLEAAVAAAEASWQQDQSADAQSAKVTELPKRARGQSKQALVVKMLQRPEGVTLAQLMDATGWQAHTLRGTFAGALKKKLGLLISSHKPQQGERIYRVAGRVDAQGTPGLTNAA